MSNPIVINSGSENEEAIPVRNSRAGHEARDTHEPDSERQELSPDDVPEDLDPNKFECCPICLMFLTKVVRHCLEAMFSIYTAFSPNGIGLDLKNDRCENAQLNLQKM